MPGAGECHPTVGPRRDSVKRSVSCGPAKLHRVDRQEVIAAANAAGLGEWADALAREAQPSLRLVAGNGTIDPFGSHLGGAPAVPAGHVWPTWRGRPHSFIGQVRLEELGDAAVSFGLPSSGLLSFFYDADQGQWGLEAGGAAGWHVAWFPSGTPLEVRPLPDELTTFERFTGRPVSFAREWTVPPWDSYEMDRVGLPAAFGVGRDIASDGFEDLQQNLDAVGSGRARHRMFGFADQIQGEMRAECELVSNGIDVTDRAAAEGPRAVELERNAALWELLLQVDSDEQLGTDWGDSGTIYYWIRRDALEARAFERAWFVLQCY